MKRAQCGCPMRTHSDYDIARMESAPYTTYTVEHTDVCPVGIAELRQELVRREAAVADARERLDDGWESLR